MPIFFNFAIPIVTLGFPLWIHEFHTHTKIRKPPDSNEVFT